MDDQKSRFNPRVMNPEANARKPYAGNKNPSRRELAAAGYETAVMADPSSPWAFEDRDTLSADAELDIMQVRRGY